MRRTGNPRPDSSPRFVPGGRFIYAAATAVAPIWGRADEVLWAEGEPLLLTGPPGVDDAHVNLPRPAH